MKHRPRGPRPGRKTRRQRFFWFGEAFVLSWMFILFVTAFLWLGSGQGGGVGLNQPAVSVTLSTQQQSGEVEGDTVDIHFLGFEGSVSVEQLAQAAQTARRCRVLVPAGVRFMAQLLGELWDAWPLA